MIQSPEYFIPASKNTANKIPVKSSTDKLEQELIEFDTDTFFDMNTHSSSE